MLLSRSVGITGLHSSGVKTQSNYKALPITKSRRAVPRWWRNLFSYNLYRGLFPTLSHSELLHTLLENFLSERHNTNPLQLKSSALSAGIPIARLRLSVTLPAHSVP